MGQILVNLVFFKLTKIEDVKLDTRRFLLWVPMSGLWHVFGTTQRSFLHCARILNPCRFLQSSSNCVIMCIHSRRPCLAMVIYNRVRQRPLSPCLMLSYRPFICWTVVIPRSRSISTPLEYIPERTWEVCGAELIDDRTTRISFSG